MNIEKIEVTIQATGKKKSYQVSWLLSDRAAWAFDSNPFLITDSNILAKLHGDFSGTPVKVRMLSKYPYLKSRIEDEEDEAREEDSTPSDRRDADAETTEAETTDKGGLDKSIDVVYESKSLEENISKMEVPELKDYLKEQGVEYNTRKKSKDYFLELALNTIK